MALNDRKYLIEVYVPKGWADRVSAQSNRLRAAAHDMNAGGIRIRYVEALFVSDDEVCFFVLEADSAEDVAEAGRRAGFGSERILRAV